jgi:hypothetical protein
MLVMLLLQGATQDLALHHLLYELIFETCPSHYANQVKKAPRIREKE